MISSCPLRSSLSACLLPWCVTNQTEIGPGLKRECSVCCFNKKVTHGVVTKIPCEFPLDENEITALLLRGAVKLLHSKNRRTSSLALAMSKKRGINLCPKVCTWIPNTEEAWRQQVKEKHWQADVSLKSELRSNGSKIPLEKVEKPFIYIMNPWWVKANLFLFTRWENCLSCHGRPEKNYPAQFS